MPAKNTRAVRTSKVTALSSDAGSPIGSRLRTLRSENNLTILELAAKSGVSAGMISQIERSNSNPSVKTLQRLAAAFDLNIWEFLEGPQERSKSNVPSFVRRKSQRPRIVLGETRLVKELLSPRHDENLRFMFVTMPPGSFTEEVLIGAGQKAGYVVTGTADLTVDDSSVTLKEGDSFQFNSEAPHRIANNSNRDAKVLWIISSLGTHL